MSATIIALAGVFVLSMVPTAALATGGCFVRCATSACKVDGAPGLSQGSWTELHACRTHVLQEGEVSIKFRVRGKIIELFAAMDGASKTVPFDKLLRSYAPIDCLSSEGNECQRGSSAIGMPSGKPFDSAAPWQPVGSPCAVALPCGLVKIPSDKWRLRLTDSAASGQLRVFTTRGQASALTVPIVSGSAELPAGWLQYGQSYRYQWINPNGGLSAAGEFTTASATMQREIDSDVTAALRQPAPTRSSALIDALFENGLDWDALQLTLDDSSSSR